MRSTVPTLLLAFAAAFMTFLAVWQFRQGGFETVFGSPPIAVGQVLYRSFKPETVKHIHISGVDGEAKFSLAANGWQASTPWEDRMDPRAAISIINFALGLRVEDLAEAKKTDPAQSGLGETAIRIRLEDENRQPLATFKLGRVSPWKAEIQDIKDPVPTVFIQPEEKSQNQRVYLCTGDISVLFKDGFKFLRDHRPFYFNPITLGKIRIRSQQGDLTLGRETAKSPWRVVKPIDLPTDPGAMKALLEGLFELQAIRITDPSAAATPATESAVKPSQIAITPLGSDKETVLEIYPPESAEANEVQATVSDRPGTRFILPLRPELGLVSLASLPLVINDLRDSTLTRLNIGSLSAISIKPSTGREILITREPPQPWMLTVDGISREANEENLFALLKAMTTHKVIGFESDAATDFSPWGLDRPILVVSFLNQENQKLELRFGIDGRGGYFVNRLGTPTVMRVDESLMASITVRPYEWRHARVWSVDRFNLVGLERKEAASPPLVLKYNFVNESWLASQDGDDVSALLDPLRANFMLTMLEGLKASRWLSSSDQEAATALANPTMVISVTEKTVNQEGNFNGIMQRVISLAPAGGLNAGFYYGRLSGEQHPFLIPSETYDKIAIKLLDE